MDINHSLHDFTKKMQRLTEFVSLHLFLLICFPAGEHPQTVMQLCETPSGILIKTDMTIF